MKIRIGNDFKTKWAITWLGEPEDFSDATDISLFFNIYDKKIELTKDVDYTITNNIIEIDVTPDICNILGPYNLELHYTKPNSDFIDGERRSAVDIDAFRIVGKSDKADATQDVSIISDAVAIFLDIAYKKLEEIEANEDVRITSENERKDAEDIRVENEDIRISNEQDRQTNTATAISNAEQATLNANNSATYANEQGAYAEEMSSHPPTIINDYWHIWNFTTNQYETTGQYARGDSAIDGALVVQEKGQSAVNTMSQKAVTDELVQLAGDTIQFEYGDITAGGVLVDSTTSIRSLPVYFNTRAKVGDLIKIEYSVINGFKTKSRIAFLGNRAVRHADGLPDWFFYNGVIRFTYDGTFDNIIFSLEKIDGGEITLSELQEHNVRIQEKPLAFTQDVTEGVNSVKKYLSKKYEVGKFNSGYITTPAVGNTISWNITANGAIKHLVIDVEKGDEFMLTGRGGSGFRLFCFVNINDVVLEVALSGTIQNDIFLIAPEKGKLIFQSYNDIDFYLAKIISTEDNAATPTDSKQLLNSIGFELGGINLNSGGPANAENRIRSLPIYFNTRTALGENIEFDIITATPLNPVTAWGYFGNKPVKRLDVLDNYRFNSHVLAFKYDGTFDNVKFTLGKSTNFTTDEILEYRVNISHQISFNTNNFVIPPLEHIYIPSHNISGIFNKNMMYPDMSGILSANTDINEIYDLYNTLMGENSNYISRDLLGYDSSGGYPIYRYDFNPLVIDYAWLLPTKKRLKFMITSGIHAEPVAIWTLYHLMSNICNNWQDDEVLTFFRFNVDFIIVPFVNPFASADGINGSRKNSNGVDINRNFPRGWVGGEPESSVYGGTQPLSEVEAQYIYNILKGDRDITAVIDYHNYSGNSNTTNFMWVIPGNHFPALVGDSFGYRMLAKWIQEYDFITPETNINKVSDNDGGMLGNQGVDFNIPFSCSFENGDRLWIDPNGSKHDSNVMNMAYESFVNFLAMTVDSITRRSL